MIFTKALGRQQVGSLIEVQPGLHIESETEEQIELTGEIFVNCKAKGFVLTDSYEVQIIIPLGSDKLPIIIDKGNQIAENYPHRYKSGELCLETDASIRIRFLDGFSLTSWMEEFVEPYYFSYEFYQRYGEFPFGERSHGMQGIIEAYQGFFQEADCRKVLALMKSVCEHTYRGHFLCPCGSGRRLRACHGPVIMKYYSDNRLKAMVRADYKLIDSEVKRYEQLRHKKEAK